jgi:hypothetical protein
MTIPAPLARRGGICWFSAGHGLRQNQFLRFHANLGQM